MTVPDEAAELRHQAVRLRAGSSVETKVGVDEKDEEDGVRDGLGNHTYEHYPSSDIAGGLVGGQTTSEALQQEREDVAPYEDTTDDARWNEGVRRLEVTLALVLQSCVLHVDAAES